MTLDEMARYEEKGGMIQRTAKLRIDDAGYLGPKIKAHIHRFEPRSQATSEAEKPKTSEKAQN